MEKKSGNLEKSGLEASNSLAKFREDKRTVVTWVVTWMMRKRRRCDILGEECSGQREQRMWRPQEECGMFEATREGVWRSTVKGGRVEGEDNGKVAGSWPQRVFLALELGCKVKSHKVPLYGSSVTNFLFGKMTLAAAWKMGYRRGTYWNQGNQLVAWCRAKWHWWWDMVNLGYILKTVLSACGIRENVKVIDEPLDLGLISCWRKRRLRVKGMLSLRWFWILKKRC